MPRRYPRWQDAAGTIIAGLWPVVVTLAVLGSPSRYNPVALYSGLGSVPFHSLATQPSTDPNIYATAYALGAHAATLLAHGHLFWWNPLEGLGSPGIGELQSGGLFPFTLLLLFHNGSFIFHVSLELVAGVATYWLLRELRCGPLVSTIGGMLFATNGTFALLGNAAFNPVCFIPLLLLGFERARRAAADGKGGGWRWIAVGGGLALLAGFIETAVIAFVLAVVVGVQRGWMLPRERLVPYIRKSVAGLAAGIAIAAPVVVAFHDYLQNGFVAEHAGNAANRVLAGPYVGMVVSPFQFGRIFGNAYPVVHSIWGAVGGYAGFAVLALGVAGMFGRRDRGLRFVLAGWVAVALADTMGVQPFRWFFSRFPGFDHIVLYRYLPPTWELALIVLAALALRDMATSSRAESVIAVAGGTAVACFVLFIDTIISPKAFRLSRVLEPRSYHQSELLILGCIALFVLAVMLPSNLRAAGIGVVAVAQAAVLFAIPLLSWPQHETVDTRIEHFLANAVGPNFRFAGLGVPTPNLGTILGVDQLDVVDLPVPKGWVKFASRLDPYENPTVFTGQNHPEPGEPPAAAIIARAIPLYEHLGVRFIVTLAYEDPFTLVRKVTLAYHDAKYKVWRLPHAQPLALARACRVTRAPSGDFLVDCPRPSVLLVNQLYMPGWSATVNGAPATIRDSANLQALVVPKGTSTVALTFLPPYVTLAAVFTILALGALLLPYEALAGWRRRRLAGSTASPVDATTPDPPTGAVQLADLAGLEDVEESGEPTTAAPLFVGTLSSASTSVTPLAGRSPDDPPTAPVELRHT
jgi:hypothetical protein